MVTSSPTPTDLRGLHPTSPQPLPFAPSIAARAFLLERDTGNILLYSTGLLDADATALARHGDIARHYLAHWHESMFHPLRQPAPLFVHAADRANVVAAMSVRAGFSRRHTLDEDFEVIPIPGHTPGSTAYLWDNGEQRFLFTGDSIWLDDGEWVGAMLESSDRESYLDSLALMRELDFDVLVPWAASAGTPYWSAADRTTAQDRIDAIIERVRAGGDR